MANKKADVAIVGVGWVGGILAAELTKAGLEVVGLERGHDRSVSDFTDDHDELRYAIRYELFQNAANETWTLRHNMQENALPMRQLGSFLPGTGIGGAGVHWNGQTWRFHPRDFTIRTSTIDRYGASAIPDGMTIQDWGITYDQLEPYYDKFEYMAGIAGKAGNLKGQKITGGNVFEGPRSREFPVKPPPDTRDRRALPERDDAARVPPVHGPDRQPAGRLQEPRRRGARLLHLLRVLRALRLRGRSEGGPDGDRAPGRAQDRQVQDHQLRLRVRREERRQDRRRASSTTTRWGACRSSRPTSSFSGPTCSTTCACCSSRSSASRTTPSRTAASSVRTTPTRRAAAGRARGSPTASSSATWAPGRCRSRSTTSTPTTSTTPGSASSAAGRSRPGRVAPARSRACRRRRGRRRSAATGRWRSARTTSAS